MRHLQANTHLLNICCAFVLPGSSQNVLETLYYIFNLYFLKNKWFSCELLTKSSARKTNDFVPFAGTHWFHICASLGVIEYDFFALEERYHWGELHFRGFACQAMLKVCWNPYYILNLDFQNKQIIFKRNNWQKCLLLKQTKIAPLTGKHPSVSQLLHFLNPDSSENVLETLYMYYIFNFDFLKKWFLFRCELLTKMSARNRSDFLRHSLSNTNLFHFCAYLCV